MTRNANVGTVFYMPTTKSIAYTVRAHDGLASVRFEAEVSIVGYQPRVTLLKDGAVWCEEMPFTEAMEAVSYLSIPHSRKATLRRKLETAAYALVQFV